MRDAVKSICSNTRSSPALRRGGDHRPTGGAVTTRRYPLIQAGDPGHFIRGTFHGREAEACATAAAPLRLQVAMNDASSLAAVSPACLISDNQFARRLDTWVDRHYCGSLALDDLRDQPGTLGPEPPWTSCWIIKLAVRHPLPTLRRAIGLQSRRNTREPGNARLSVVQPIELCLGARDSAATGGRAPLQPQARPGGLIRWVRLWACGS